MIGSSSKDQDNFSESWDLSELTDKRSGGPIRAAEGKFKGCYLDWSDVELDIMDSGKTKHVRDLI